MPRGPSKERSVRMTVGKSSQQHTTNVVCPMSARPLQSILVSSSSPQPEASTSSSSSSRSVSGSSTTSSQQQVSGKCVHFPCAPEKLNKVAYTHSRELYDRSPILPSAGAASLDIPSCRNDDEQGSWIQCLQRKVKEAVDEGLPAPHTKPVEASTPEHNTVAQFVSPPPAAYDSSSGTSSSDTEELFTPLSCSPPLGTPSMSPDPQAKPPATFDWASFCAAQEKSAMVDAGVEEEEDEDCEMMVSSEEEAEPVARRPGMCSLGKFSRSTLFECDAFGGF